MERTANGEVGGASGEWIKSGKGGGSKGKQRVKRGEREALISGSGMHQEGFHLQEWGRVVVKLREDCHHLLNTDVTDREEEEEENPIRSTLFTLCVCFKHPLNIPSTTFI